MEDNANISIRSKVIYWAEDDLDDLLLFEAALSELSSAYHLISFANGQKLLDYIRDGLTPKPDIVLLDINMPVMNGLETLQDIRSKVSKDLPVFVLSTAEDNFSVENA